MAKSVASFVRHFTLWFLRLNNRERTLICVTGICLLGFAVYTVAAQIELYIVNTERVLAVRTQQLDELSRVIQRYKSLKGRLERVQRTFAQSQMTFKEVTDQLDKIVRQTIGNNTYDLKKGGSPSQIGFEYEKQAFTLNIRSLTLEQVTRLLYQLEQGDSPLSLGKVDVIKAPADNTYSATLEIFSIQKS
jgi:hypothetical protein